MTDRLHCRFLATLALVVSAGISLGLSATPLNTIAVDVPQLSCSLQQGCDSIAQTRIDDFAAVARDKDQALRHDVTVTRKDGVERYHYLYTVNAHELLERTKQQCLVGFSVPFGPVASVDYDSDGYPDAAFLVSANSAASALINVALDDDTLAIRFPQPICVTADSKELNVVFGASSFFPPSGSTANLLSYDVGETCDRNICPRIDELGTMVPFTEKRRTITVDCDAGQSAQRAIEQTQPGDKILLAGHCQENLKIDRSGITLEGRGESAISGEQYPDEPALMIAGATDVLLANLMFRDGAEGIRAVNGAQLTVINTIAERNRRSGYAAENSIIRFVGALARGNGGSGFHVAREGRVVFDDSSAAIANAENGLNIEEGGAARLNPATLRGAVKFDDRDETGLGTAGIKADEGQVWRFRKMSFNAAATATTPEACLMAASLIDAGLLNLYECLQAGQYYFGYNGAPAGVCPVVDPRSTTRSGIRVVHSALLEILGGSTVLLEHNGDDGMVVQQAVIDVEESSVIANENCRHGVNSKFLGNVNVTGSVPATPGTLGTIGHPSAISSSGHSSGCDVCASQFSGPDILHCATGGGLSFGSQGGNAVHGVGGAIGCPVTGAEYACPNTKDCTLL